MVQSIGIAVCFLHEFKQVKSGNVYAIVHDEIILFSHLL